MSTMTVTLDHRGRLVYRGSGVKRSGVKKVPATKAGADGKLRWPDLPNERIAPVGMGVLKKIGESVAYLGSCSGGMADNRGLLMSRPERIGFLLPHSNLRSGSFQATPYSSLPS